MSVLQTHLSSVDNPKAMGRLAYFALCVVSGVLASILCLFGPISDLGLGDSVFLLISLIGVPSALSVTIGRLLRRSRGEVYWAMLAAPTVTVVTFFTIFVISLGISGSPQS
jgi:hypothetical protein